LVKDRLELTGMRWERQGAQSMLHLRAIYLNGEWDQFVKYRIEQEQAALYGPSTPYEKVGGYAQAI
jgi:CYTH domain-containing protein